MTRTSTDRPRRRRLGADERRAQIIDATVRVVAQSGCVNASADAIARSAGVSKGLLWHYFGSQNALLEQTLTSTAAVLRDSVAAAIDMEAPAPDLIRSALHSAAAVAGTHATERRAITEIVRHFQQTNGPGFGAEQMSELYALQEAHIFGRGQDAQLLRGDVPARALAVVYQSTVDGMLDYLEDHPELDARAFVDHVADVLLGGMLAPPHTAAE